MFKSQKDKYCEFILEKILVKKEDLTEIEQQIIDYSFEVLKERLEDIKLQNDEIVRLKIELANLKSYLSEI
jgi:hypothetical protein